jgi:threonyl-tRNA synthetase
VWEKAQNIMRELLKNKGIEFKEAVGEAAFYGPKIDIMAVDAIGRQWQISTVQLDFVQPARFQLEYTAEDGTKKTPVMIHRALIGSPDRFLGVLIEHYAGAFPLWMAPVQVTVLPVSDKHLDYAQGVVREMQTAGIRAELSADDSLGKRIRNTKLARVPFFIVVGEKEVEDKTVTVENNRTGDKNTTPLADFMRITIDEIKARAA